MTADVFDADDISISSPTSLELIPSVKGQEDCVSVAEFEALTSRLEALEQSRTHTNGSDYNGKKAPQFRWTESQVENLDDDFELPADTYTLLMTAPVCSIPFFAGFIAPALSASCVILVFINEIDKGTTGNPFGVPAGVSSGVRVAQYLGVIIGILMEQEIPQGLLIIGKGAEQEQDGIRWSRLILTSLLRMTIGYLYICCLFLTVMQEESVLTIFFGKCKSCLDIQLDSFMRFDFYFHAISQTFLH
jgi:hypothetical protein